jgi:glycosyltransferase involved in cell wall biosynthesis
VFLHVSRTEGFPQVLMEAFASCLPTVATAVGGVPAAADGAAVLVPPDDAHAAAEAIERIVADATLRERLVLAGSHRARVDTLEATSRAVVRFLEDA